MSTEISHAIEVCDAMAKMWDEHGLHPKDAPEAWMKAGVDVSGLTDETLKKMVHTYRIRKALVKQFAGVSI